MLTKLLKSKIGILNIAHTQQKVQLKEFIISLNKKINSKDLEFEKYLEKIENHNYDGSDVSWDLAKNPTPLQKVKHQICEAILNFQMSNNLSDKLLSERLNNKVGILFISYFLWSTTKVCRTKVCTWLTNFSLLNLSSVCSSNLLLKIKITLKVERKSFLGFVTW